MADHAIADAALSTGIPTDKNASDAVTRSVMESRAPADGEDKKVRSDVAREKAGSEKGQENDEDTFREEQEGDEGEADEGEDQGEGEEEDAGDGEEEADEGLDDDDPLVTVTVDGEEREVALSKLKAEYSGNAAIEGRLSQATELRNGYYKIGEALYSNLEAQAVRLQSIDAVLKDIAEPSVDWERLRAVDPQRYLIEKDKASEAQNKRMQLSQEGQRIAQEQERLRQLSHQTKVQEETVKFVERVPEIRDPAKASRFMKDLVDVAGAVYKISPQEVASLADHRQLLVLRDAVKYRQLVAANKNRLGKPKPNGSDGPMRAPIKSIMRPGANKDFSKRMDAAKADKAKINRARETGSIDDVAAMLIVRKKK